MSAEGARFLHAPIEWGGVPVDTGELLEPVSELGAAKPELYAKILGDQALNNVELGRE